MNWTTASRCVSPPVRSCSAALSCGPIRTAAYGTWIRIWRAWKPVSSRPWMRATESMQSFSRHAEPRRPQEPLRDSIRQTLTVLGEVVAAGRAELTAREVGRVVSVGQGVAQVRGLPGVQAEEIGRAHV